MRSRHRYNAGTEMCKRTEAPVTSILNLFKFTRLLKLNNYFTSTRDDDISKYQSEPLMDQSVTADIHLPTHSVSDLHDLQLLKSLSDDYREIEGI
ncbi:hypothetical protein NDU88_005086 [Pleurodeles waltl]|uniref:Uncharacterized protein n=1 Tax=Pleurodeles waltl TaxID=8319 RepID=A0AAV7WTR6_PLEWA|nr:hypothetical protein NDU88_005086 [Pleurodeles waltl]